MRPVDAERSGERASLARGIRIDLAIAVSALVVSSLATAASWWQTHVIQQQLVAQREQLSAQVWPYVGFSGGIEGSTVRISFKNEGLGPAVLRNASVAVDGKAKSNFVEALHAIVGPNIRARSGREKAALFLAGSQPGSVLGVGESMTLFSFTSRRFAPSFIRAYRRIDTRVCYCAIVPKTCFLQDSNAERDPIPLPACRTVPNDLLHTSLVDVLAKGF